MKELSQFEIMELIKVYARRVANQYEQNEHVALSMQEDIARMQELSKCLTTGTPQPEYSYETETETENPIFTEIINETVDRWMEDCRPQVYDMEIKSLKHRLKNMIFEK